MLPTKLHVYAMLLRKLLKAGPNKITGVSKAPSLANEFTDSFVYPAGGLNKAI